MISVFAARAALRSLPKLILGLNSKSSNLPVLSLSCFWATSVSLSSGHWTAQSDKLFKTAYAAADADATYPDAAAEAAAEYSLDRDFIKSGNRAEDLAKAPLWSDTTTKTYKNLSENWTDLKAYLLKQDENWWVLTQWYEDRLRGNAEQPFTFPFVEAVEIGEDFENGKYGRCTLPEKFYKDPSKANAAIAEIIEGYWKGQKDAQDNEDTPTQNAATVKPIIRNGRIYLDDQPLKADLEIRLAIDNMLALRDEFEEFVESIGDEENFDKLPVSFLKALASLIPDELPNSRVLFRLIRKEAAMEKHEGTVLQQWPQFYADRYSSLLTELTQVLDQFPDRRSFQRQKLSAEIEDVDFDKFNQEFDPVISAIVDAEELIDKAIPEAIQEIRSDTSNTDTPLPRDLQLTIVADQLDSSNNLMKILTDLSLDPEASKHAIRQISNAYASGAVEGLTEGTREIGFEDFKKVGAAVARAEAARTVGKALTEKYPERFKWFERWKRKHLG